MSGHFKFHLKWPNTQQGSAWHFQRVSPHFVAPGKLFSKVRIARFGGRIKNTFVFGLYVSSAGVVAIAVLVAGFVARLWPRLPWRPVAVAVAPHVGGPLLFAEGKHLKQRPADTADGEVRKRKERCFFTPSVLLLASWAKLCSRMSGTARATLLGVAVA